jgi:hypothetical protein
MQSELNRDFLIAIFFCNNASICFHIDWTITIKNKRLGRTVKYVLIKYIIYLLICKFWVEKLHLIIIIIIIIIIINNNNRRIH